MTTLRTVLAIAGMSAALTLAACKSKESAKAAPAPTPAAPAVPAAPPAPVVPPECADYKAAVDKLATCASLPPASRDAIKQRFEATAASWASIPAEGRAALAATCKNATEAMKASVEACSH